MLDPLDEKGILYDGFTKDNLIEWMPCEPCEDDDDSVSENDVVDPPTPSTVNHLVSLFTDGCQSLRYYQLEVSQLCEEHINDTNDSSITLGQQILIKATHQRVANPHLFITNGIRSDFNVSEEHSNLTSNDNNKLDEPDIEKVVDHRRRRRKTVNQMSTTPTKSVEIHSDSDSDIVSGDNLIKAEEILEELSISEIQKNPKGWSKLISSLKQANWTNFDEFSPFKLSVVISSLNTILQQTCNTLEGLRSSSLDINTTTIAPATVMFFLLSKSKLKSLGECVDTLVDFSINFARCTFESSSQGIRTLFEGIQSICSDLLCETHAERLLPVLLREIFRGKSQAIPCLATLEILMKKFTKVLGNNIAEDVSQWVVKSPAPIDGRGPSTAIISGKVIHLSPFSATLLLVTKTVCINRDGFIRMTDLLNEIIQSALSLSLSETFTKERQDRVRVDAILNRLVSDMCDIAADPNYAAASVVCSVLLKCIVKYVVDSGSGCKSFQSTVTKNIAISALERFGRLLLSVNTSAVDKSVLNSFSSYLQSASHLRLDQSSIDVIKYSMSSSNPGDDTEIISETQSKSTSWRICMVFQTSFPCSIFTQKITTLVGILVGILIDTSSSVSSRRAALRVVSALIKCESHTNQLTAYAGMLLRKTLNQSSPLIRELGLDLVPVIRSACQTSTGTSSSNNVAVNELLQLLASEKSATVVRKVLSLLTGAVLEADSKLRVFILSKIFTSLAPLLQLVETVTENRLRSEIHNLLSQIWNFTPVSNLDSVTGKKKKSLSKSDIVIFREKKREKPSNKQTADADNHRILSELASLLVLGMRDRNIKGNYSSDCGISETVISVLRSSASEADLRSLLSVAQTSPAEDSNKSAIVIHSLCKANPNIVSSFSDCVLLGQLLDRSATEIGSHPHVPYHISSAITVCCQDGQLLSTVGQGTLFEHIVNPLVILQQRSSSQQELSSLLSALCFLCKAVVKKDIVVDKTISILQTSVNLVTDYLELNIESECRTDSESDSDSDSDSDSSSNKKMTARDVAVSHSLFTMCEIVRFFPMRLRQAALEKRSCTLSDMFSLSQKILKKSTKLSSVIHSLAIRLVMSTILQDPVTYLRRCQTLLRTTIDNGGTAAMQVIQGFCHFLREEVRICSATATTSNTKTTSSKFDNDQREASQMITGLGAEIVQLYTAPTINLCITAPENGVKQLAIEFISVAASQGLCSPIILSEVLVALTGGVHKCQSTEGHLMRLAKRFPKEVMSKLSSGVRVGFVLEMNSSGKPASDIHGYSITDYECSYSAVFKTMQANVHTQDVMNITVQLLRYLTFPIYIKTISSSLEYNVFNSVHCLRYIAEVIAHLPFIKLREVLNLLKVIDSEVSLRSETLFDSKDRTRDEWLLLCGLYLSLLLKKCLKMKFNVSYNAMQRFTEQQMERGRKSGTQQGVPVVDLQHRNFYKEIENFCKSIDACRSCNTKTNKITKLLWDRMVGKLESAINADVKTELSFAKQGKRKGVSKAKKRRKTHSSSSSSSTDSSSSSTSSTSSLSSDSSSDSSCEQQLYQQSKTRRTGVLQPKLNTKTKTTNEIKQRSDIENLISSSEADTSGDDSMESSSSS